MPAKAGEARPPCPPMPPLRGGEARTHVRPPPTANAGSAGEARFAEFRRLSGETIRIIL